MRLGTSQQGLDTDNRAVYLIFLCLVLLTGTVGPGTAAVRLPAENRQSPERRDHGSSLYREVFLAVG